VFWRLVGAKGGDLAWTVVKAVVAPTVIAATLAWVGALANPWVVAAYVAGFTGLGAVIGTVVTRATAKGSEILKMWEWGKERDAWPPERVLLVAVDEVQVTSVGRILVKLRIVNAGSWAWMLDRVSLSHVRVGGWTLEAPMLAEGVTGVASDILDQGDDRLLWFRGRLAGHPPSDAAFVEVHFGSEAFGKVEPAGTVTVCDPNAATAKVSANIAFLKTRNWHPIMVIGKVVAQLS